MDACDGGQRAFLPCIHRGPAGGKEAESRVSALPCRARPLFEENRRRRGIQWRDRDFARKTGEFRVKRAPGPAGPAAAVATRAAGTSFVVGGTLARDTDVIHGGRDDQEAHVHCVLRYTFDVGNRYSLCGHRPGCVSQSISASYSPSWLCSQRLALRVALW